MSALDTALIRALRSAEVNLPAGEIAGLLHSTPGAVTAGVAALREAGFDIEDRPGLGVKVTVEGDNNIYSGRVARISPAFQEQSRTLVVEAEVENQHGRLHPGSFAKADLQTSASKAIVTIPPSALVTFAGIQKIFFVKDGKAIERTVVVGRKETDWVEITEGLKSGEMIVENPDATMVGGQPVIVQ